MEKRNINRGIRGVSFSKPQNPLALKEPTSPLLPLNQNQQSRLKQRRKKLKISRCHLLWLVVPLFCVEIIAVGKIQGAILGRIVASFLRCSGEKVLPQLLMVTHYNKTVTDHMRQWMQQQEQNHINDDSFVPCENDRCNASLNQLWAYNPWSSNVYLCGQEIAPKEATELISCCQESPRVFQEEHPSCKGIHIKLYKQNQDTKKKRGKNRYRSFKVEARTKTHTCSVPCRFVDTKLGTPTTLIVEGTSWQIKHTMESGLQYEKMQVKKDDWKRDVYYSTTSFESEIPLPYFSFADYNIRTAPVKYDKVIKGASFLASNCVKIKNSRNDVVKELMNTIRVDSFGSCLHNAEPPSGITNVRLRENLQKLYLFHLAFENSNEVDYITEKMWGTLQSGSLPVYMGAPNIKDHVPTNSIISWHDFNSTRELGTYLQVVAANKSLYESYHAWRSQPTNADDDDLALKYNFTKTHSACRTLSYHDGVVDIFLEGTASYAYRIATDMKVQAKKLRSNVHQLQDELSRITFVVDSGLDVSINGGGVVEFLSRHGRDEAKRIRVITEDVDTFHQDADDAISYFGNLMITQFELPLQFFTTKSAQNNGGKETNGILRY